MSDSERLGRWFGPKTADHPSIGLPCPLCGVPFKEGDQTGLVNIRPASDEDAAKAERGLPHTCEAKELHRACIASAWRAFDEYSTPRQAPGNYPPPPTCERISACIRACAGIENPSGLRQQRDDLLAACEMAMPWLGKLIETRGLDWDEALDAAFSTHTDGTEADKCDGS